jgi:hypothetical protein
MYDVGLDPLESYPGSHKPWKCRCRECGHECSPRLHSISQGQGACDWCGNKRTGAVLRTDENVAYQIMRNASLEPLEPYPGSNKIPWRCRCLKCGNEECAPHLNGITQGQGGCRYCAEHGFNFNEPALVYLMRHDGLAAVKIGITSMVAKQDRIVQHQHNGWRVMFRWPTPTGYRAWEIEKEMLRWWREEIGAPPAVNRKKMPQGGYTETVSLSFVSMREIRARVESLRSELLGIGAQLC